MDGDGDQDVIALSGGYENRPEENIHYLYENWNGSFVRAPLPLPSFPASVVKPVDFDRDGDPDFVLGNLGENHRFTISDQYPLRIYAFDLDMNGTLDPISTGYWRDRYDEMTEYPINYLDELAGQSSFFLKGPW